MVHFWEKFWKECVYWNQNSFSEGNKNAWDFPHLTDVNWQLIFIFCWYYEPHKGI
jgi:hypothetical protein